MWPSARLTRSSMPGISVVSERVPIRPMAQGMWTAKCVSRVAWSGKPKAVKAAGEKAVAHCRAGKGPYILEVMTYRYRGHSMSDPAKYRTREEVQKMRDERDPIENIREMLLTGKHATEEDLKALDKEIKDIVNDSAEFAKDSPEPDLAELWTDIYADELPQGSAEENA